MLLLMHIVAGIASVGFAGATFVTPKTKIPTIIATLATVITGAELIFQGSSWARVCGEAAILTIFAAIAIARANQTKDKGVVVREIIR